MSATNFPQNIYTSPPYIYYMEEYEGARDKAKRHIKIADHMLTQTYPLIQDPKLLLAVMDNIFSALTNSMSAILYYERLFKRIPPFHNSFDSKFNIFRARCVRRYSLSTDYVVLIQIIREVIKEHKESPFEFSRKGKFVICSDNYRMKTISVDKLKDYIRQTKDFVAEMERMVDQNGRVS